MSEHVSQIEIDWALKQLQALGYIEFGPDGRFYITDRGRERARQLLSRMPVDERIVVGIYSSEVWREIKE